MIGHHKDMNKKVSDVRRTKSMQSVNEFPHLKAHIWNHGPHSSALCYETWKPGLVLRGSSTVEVYITRRRCLYVTVGKRTWDDSAVTDATTVIVDFHCQLMWAMHTVKGTVYHPSSIACLFIATESGVRTVQASSALVGKYAAILKEALTLKYDSRDSLRDRFSWTHISTKCQQRT